VTLIAGVRLAVSSIENWGEGRHCKERHSHSIQILRLAVYSMDKGGN